MKVRLRIILCICLLLMLWPAQIAWAGDGIWTQSNGPCGGEIYPPALSPALLTDHTPFADDSRSADGGDTWTPTGLRQVRAVAFSPNHATDHTLLTAMPGHINNSIACWQPPYNLHVLLQESHDIILILLEVWHDSWLRSHATD